MASKYYVIVLLGLLISSCAQVGVISGGEVDKFAPKPISEEVVPPIETTNFQGNRIEIPFDEYFRLLNPVENIRMVPPHATILATVKNKTLILSWKDTLESNTTYAIYLNNAIKDLTEGNDSIMQYVFSTGPLLDTLSYSVLVINAWSGKAEDQCIVALFEPDSDKLVSFTKPSGGTAKLNYLPSGEYTLVAFKDENNDLKLQDYENIGFPEGGKVHIDSNVFDSIPLRMYKPKLIPKIRSLKFNAPGSFIIGASVPIQGDFQDVLIDGRSVLHNDITFFSPDSLLVLTDQLEGSSVEIIIETASFSDTTTYRFKPKELESKIKISSLSKGVIKPSEDAAFSVNSRILSIDSTKIHLELIRDSSSVSDFEIVHFGNVFDVRPKLAELDEIKITFNQGAIRTICGESDPFNTTATYGQLEDFGTLNVTVSDYSGAVIVDLLQRSNIVSSSAVKDTRSPLVLTELTPGEYSFRVIRDANSNGKWDVGEYSTLTQPERVDMYSKTTKVRANWTIDVTLTPTK